MQVHVGGAVIALVLVVSHYRSHPVRPRSQDLTRRAVLRTAGLGATASVVLAIWEGTLDAAGLEGGQRRFTGSHERGSGRPERMPVTSWLDDRVQHIPAGEWVLQVGERSLSFDDVMSLPRSDMTAVLDCTSAWYAEQVWSGVRLDRLVDPATCRSVEVRSATGYARRFPSRDLSGTWLVTHVGGEPLSAGHGYPARIAAPGRRGFWWVKWVTSLTPSDVPWWVQSPFPVT
jgi:DMSO/TMAO reductase YedYZ molybdopterin-dependent catalytic subunit